ncbi:MipA/OmpV family protein [Temperatibacter marinus]|uniref:MipA/OmpV family protein n=1 Tax=Temperatibacter marinus TaxID=1456591 RepID=A0AA52H9C6_9PROT|nr:MipA/OmpV family protein [Temperatibacter marinus]WND03051.1 MipA/OmpV family protein [Temperatibacter marinus]
MKNHFCIFVFLLSGMAFPLKAQDFDIVEQFNNTIAIVQGGIDDLMDTKLMKGTRMKVGFAIGTTPDYQGSNNYSFRFLPMINIQYKDKWAMENGHFHYNLWRQGHWTAGPLASLNFGREERQNKVLAGIGNVGDTLDLGLFLKYSRRETGSVAEVKVRHGLSNGQGMRAELTVGQAFYKKGNLLLIGGLRAKYMAKKTMQTNFGISPEQASTSIYGLEAFEAKGGLSQIMSAIIAVREFPKKRFRIMGVLSYGHMLSSAANSPLVSGGKSVGDSSQFVFGTAITYNF